MDADRWDLYLTTLREFREAGRGERPAGRWNSSSLGKCPQSLIRAQLGDPGENSEISAKTRRTFAFGDIIGDIHKERSGRMGFLVYPPEGSEWHLTDDELRCSGYIDRLEISPPQTIGSIPEEVRGGWSEDWVKMLEGMRDAAREQDDRAPGYYIIEDKSIKASSMTYPPLWEGDAPGSPKPEHTLQIGSYVLMAKRNPDQLPGPIAGASVVYTGKDSGGMLEFPVDLDLAAALAEDRIKFLTAEFAKDTTSDITCECHDSNWMPFWCNHRYLLEERKGPKGGRRIYAECCSGANVERAWKAGDEAL